MSGWSAVTAKEAEPGTWVIADSECNETGEGKGLESLKDAFDDSKVTDSRDHGHPRATRCGSHVDRLSYIQASAPYLRVTCYFLSS